MEISLILFLRGVQDLNANITTRYLVPKGDTLCWIFSLNFNIRSIQCPSWVSGILWAIFIMIFHLSGPKTSCITKLNSFREKFPVFHFWRITVVYKVSNIVQIFVDVLANRPVLLLTRSAGYCCISSTNKKNMKLNE